MPKANDPPGASPPPPKKPVKTEAAFDVWLHRGLQELYGNIANEPIPEDLIKLIEDDRKK